MKFNVDGKAFVLDEPMSVAAALATVGDGSSRDSVSGQRRAPVCGMGICQECRVMIDGVRRLACQTPCSDGMSISTFSSRVGGE
ncbi:2Fe-2S iron-sulfur cluster-binding protein [Vibrio ziniensis]|uniref:(2Fe-2S)-binding protein n=1 Tax=Vibrio ziniensis TaxID=2711221 RepID=A0A6G7CIZ8_9VIBR|nr:2Fe-2S iron-sulfur cluster-binding protein [Vibrio ziniensis]QIH42085.1 (2Fe-2S)-binding protein [Vibrio ziniensis]